MLAGIVLMTIPCARMVAQTVAVGAPATAPRAALVTVNADDAPVEMVLRTIAKQAGLRLVFGEQVTAQTKRVTLHVHDITADEAFSKALMGTGLKARIAMGSVIFSETDGVSATDGVITGSVVDAKTKRPIVGARVTLDERKQGVTTAEKGTFQITGVAAGKHVVRVRMVGYAKGVYQVEVTDGNSVAVSAILEPSVNSLDQVVVTGTVIPTELKAVPNAITVITAQDLERRGITSIDQLFHGDVPGIYSPMPREAVNLGEVVMWSRGSTNLDGGPTAIKTYVDGIELADPRYLGLLDPKSIERIEILTGPQASTIYGSRAINGVMQVFTKRGITTRPQVTVALQTGFIQNNFSSNVAPEQDHQIQASGMSGTFSYNIGASYGHISPWTPAVMSTTLSGFAGAHLQRSAVTVDANWRRVAGQNMAHAVEGQVTQNRTWNGEASVDNLNVDNLASGFEYLNTDQTLGTTISVAPVSWWSVTSTIGDGALSRKDRQLGDGEYKDPGDTLPYNDFKTASRRTISGSSTLRVRLLTRTVLDITAGGDATNDLETEVTIRAHSLEHLTGSERPQYSYSTTHNRGGFVQSQLALWDAVFLTYGLRAEWNPGFGANVTPNLAPRYGIAMTRDFGALTVKVRGSYGRATQPPGDDAKNGFTCAQADPYYQLAYGADCDLQKPNPNLLPSHQRGGEGGVELWYGNTGALQITRYNQTDNDQIKPITVDSVQMTAAGRAIYTYCVKPWDCQLSVFENVNVGSVRNEGWEVVAHWTTGPLTNKGTYSWTKSRIIGITERWRPYYGGRYVVGGSFSQFPEHTWALEEIYARGGTSVSLNIHGEGRTLHNLLGILTNRYQYRLPLTMVRYTPIGNAFINGMPGYALADLNASQRFSSRTDGTLQIQNLSNAYHNEGITGSAVMGRLTKLGLRLRF